MREGLINDEFEAEYFCGHGYASVIFEGESSNPQKVAEEISAEIERIRVEGINRKLFSAVKCAMYGDAIRRFNSVNELATQLVECAMCDFDLFEEIKLLKTVTIDDVFKRLSAFNPDNTVLSVILPKE